MQLLPHGDLWYNISWNEEDMGNIHCLHIAYTPLVLPNYSTSGQSLTCSSIGGQGLSLTVQMCLTNGMSNCGWVPFTVYIFTQWSAIVVALVLYTQTLKRPECLYLSASSHCSCVSWAIEIAVTFKYVHSLATYKLHVRLAIEGGVCLKPRRCWLYM